MPRSTETTKDTRLNTFATGDSSSAGREGNLDYGLLKQQLQGLIDNETDAVANLANVAALLWQEVPKINWVGFYLLKQEQLVLGPFQGKPACSRISIGEGVCGTAAAMGRTIVVADVHQFPGHIACDLASKSEIVVPLWRDGQLLGLLDIDSPVIDRFDYLDQQGLEELMQTLLARLELPL
jgi:GAF domain-containing protein